MFCASLLISLDIVPSTMLDLARQPAEAFRALLNIKKHDPVTRERKRQKQRKEQMFKSCNNQTFCALWCYRSETAATFL